MKLPRSARFRQSTAIDGAGALVSLLVAVVLFTRFSIDGNLSRDEAIYVYGGQQLAHGVPMYVSIFDAKTPLAVMLAGLAVALGHLVGVTDLGAIRLAFFVAACLTVVAVYALGLRLFRSALAGLAAAVVFAAFQGFAADALAGPDAKTPGILFAVVSMLLVVERRWFWGAVAGALSFLVWQPLLVYALVAMVVALLNGGAGQRTRAFLLAVAGAAVPIVVTVVYFWLAGGLGELIESTLTYPVIGLRRGPSTLSDNLNTITRVVHDSYGFGDLFWLGLALFVVLVLVHVVRGRRRLSIALREPLVSVVLISLVLDAAYSVSDFQGAPDLYPLLPYPALGFGGAAALLVSLVPPTIPRRVAAALVLAAALVCTVAAASAYSNVTDPTAKLPAQRADACALTRMLGHGTLYALGSPTPLALTDRRNPDRFVYLASGVSKWKVEHTNGGFGGWTREIQSAHPKVIVVSGWQDRLRVRMGRWLHRHYESAYVGGWRVFLASGVRTRAKRLGVRLTRSPTRVATGPRGHMLPEFCRVRA